MPVLSIINVTYNIGQYFAVFKWYSPTNDEPEVMNYTIALQDDHDDIQSETVSYDVLAYCLYLKYSTNYSITVYATNCKGSGNSTFFTMFEGK